MEDRTNRRGNGEVMAVHGGFEAEHEDDVTFVSQLNYRSHDVISSVLFRESPSLRFTGCVKAGEGARRPLAILHKFSGGFGKICPPIIRLRILKCLSVLRHQI
jgi:hypothetical protein